MRDLCFTAAQSCVSLTIFRTSTVPSICSSVARFALVFPRVGGLRDLVSLVPLKREKGVLCSLPFLSTTGLNIFQQVGGDTMTTEVSCRMCKAPVTLAEKLLPTNFLMQMHLSYLESLESFFGHRVPAC